MHVFFSGIGGAGVGPLAMIAQQAGYDVSGSDAYDSAYIQSLRDKGITEIYIGQSREQIAAVHQEHPIDWFVYSSALPLTNPNHPELVFCREAGIKLSRRDEFLSQLIASKNLKLVAVAGTHGKTTTTAMLIWQAQQLGIRASWSVGAKLSFGDMGHYDPDSRYFIYEADEFDRNFLSFYPHISLIPGLDWDHPDIYPTRASYLDAFVEFLDQSQRAVLWHNDAELLGLEQSDKYLILDAEDPAIDSQLHLVGRVNRLDAWLVAKTVAQLGDFPFDKCLEVLNHFPGLSRRFEKITDNIYSDYAHTPPKIRGALQLAGEAAGDNIVVVYEGLHNTRQHFIRDELADLFENVKRLYVVPSYLAREDKNLELLTPEELLKLTNVRTRSKGAVAELNDDLQKVISHHTEQGDLVLCLSAGGAGSLDEWLRREFSK